MQESTYLVQTQKVIKPEKLEKSNTTLFQVSNISIYLLKNSTQCYEKGRYTTLNVVAVASQCPEIYVSLF